MAYRPVPAYCLMDIQSRVNELLLDFTRHFYLKPLIALAFPLGIEMAIPFIRVNSINKA
jgi:hypothetical protein